MDLTFKEETLVEEIIHHRVLFIARLTETNACVAVEEIFVWDI